MVNPTEPDPGKLEMIAPKNEWGRDLIRLNKFSKALVILAAISFVGAIVAQGMGLRILVQVFETILWAGFAMVPVIWLLLRRLVKRIPTEAKGDRE